MRPPQRLSLIRSSAIALAALFHVSCLPSGIATEQRVATEQLVLRFHDQPTVSSAVVRLRDVVEIMSGKVTALDDLRELPLGPAPRDGQAQTWHSADIMQHLELRGMESTSIRWTGKDQVQLYATPASSESAATSLTPAFIDERLVDVARTNAILAIKDYLNLRTKSRTDWRVDLSVEPPHVKLLQVRNNIASIGGGQEPWTGEQTFIIQVKYHGKLIDVSIAATVDMPPMVVVATGPLRRDQLLTAEMLTYAPLPRNADERQYYTKVESLIGKQLRKSVSTRQAISEDLLGDPIIVQRNELVEVESVSGAIVVRTTAKSLSTGASGDLIDIEMPNRRRLMATVVGPAQVRISAVSLPTAKR